MCLVNNKELARFVIQSTNTSFSKQDTRDLVAREEIISTTVILIVYRAVINANQKGLIVVAKLTLYCCVISVSPQFPTPITSPETEPWRWLE